MLAIHTLTEHPRPLFVKLAMEFNGKSAGLTSPRLGEAAGGMPPHHRNDPVYEGYTRHKPSGDPPETHRRPTGSPPEHLASFSR